MRTILLTLLTVVSLLSFASCGSDRTPDGVLGQLREMPEHRFMYYAPLHIGRCVLTGDDHLNSQAYIASHYGDLVDQGLLEVSQHEKNAWRTVINISLTEQGKGLLDANRSDEEHAFVAVCQLVPDSVLTIGELTIDTLICKYIATIQNVTPFGEFMNFETGKEYQLEIKLRK
ncbi:MAG: hypothetical protein R3Y19_01590 [Rikenellaceae bacterium]